MMDFGRWMAKQGQKEEDPPKVEDLPQEDDPDERIYLECCSCGKTEVVTRRYLENGDTGWYVADYPEGQGLCGGPYCMP